ncbi:MAG: ABC transporter ATP-binding protein [Planctomycetes bacterium]|nr:ABC transporter ATP-binding protein [Planctomycetota bacterium]
MTNFFRVLRLAGRYRWMVLGIVVSSLAVAAFWGGNIGIVYPFMEVVFERKSLHDWVDRKLETSRGRIDELEQDLAAAARGESDDPKARQLNEVHLQAELQVVGFLERLQPWIHGYLPSSPFPTLVVIVMALVVGTLVKDGFLMANMMLVERLVHRMMFDLRKHCFRKVLRLDVREFGDKGTSALLSRLMHDTGNVAGGLNQLFGSAIREPLKMLCCLVLASLICWQLLLFSLILAPLALFLIKRLSQSIKRASRRGMEEISRMYGVVSESFNGIQTVKAFTMERHERRRFHRSAKQFLANSMKLTFYNALTKPITEVLGISVISLALVTGAYLALTQEMYIFGIRMTDRPLDPKLLLVFYGLLAGISDPVRKLSEIYSAIQGAVAASERVFGLVDSQPSIVDPKNPRPMPDHFLRLQFKQVHYHYTPERPVLRGIDLELKAGETIAIVGSNGCGKTTLVNMVPRFFDPVVGAVLMDGVDIREFRVRELRSRIGLVTQHTQLFDDTVMNNIRYGSPHASDDEVIEAARKAHAHQFIGEKLEAGYATRVGQGGCKLSGGQRQRIALARAILRDPAILILDEATSQVDLESEQLIHKVLEEFVRGRTAIMITHRLSTLALADRVLVMDAGEIVDIGRHDELLERCELYRRLHEIQFRQSA